MGVPVHFRPLLWQCLTKVETSDAGNQYAQYLKMTSPCEKVIRRDITRTFPEHDFFKEKHGLGQESLFNVIKVSDSFVPNATNSEGLLFPCRRILCMIAKWAIVKASVSSLVFSSCTFVFERERKKEYLIALHRCQKKKHSPS